MQLQHQALKEASLGYQHFAVSPPLLLPVLSEQPRSLCCRDPQQPCTLQRWLQADPRHPSLRCSPSHLQSRHPYFAPVPSLLSRCHPRHGTLNVTRAPRGARSGDSVTSSYLKQSPRPTNTSLEADTAQRRWRKSPATPARRKHVP